MKCIAIILLYLSFNSKQCFCQSMSWFAGAGAGVTQLHAKKSAGNPSTHSGRMAIVTGGLDFPLHENLRPMVRATISGYGATFHTVQIHDRNISQSYSIYLNSITPELSFLYNIVNKKMKLYLGVGLDINCCWNSRTNYKMQSLQTGFIYWDEQNYIPLEPCWPSFNVKTGIKLGKWELGTTGYIRGILAWNDYDILTADVYFMWIGYHFINKKSLR